MSDQLRHEWITAILKTVASVRARQVEGVDPREELQARLSGKSRTQSIPVPA